MPRVVQTLKTSGFNKVLDLGCGTGRHVVYLTKSGFSVFGLDSSPEGIHASRAWLAGESLEADIRVHDMTAPLPFEDGFFDAVVSVQVIHHAVMATIEHIIREMTRVLVPGGFLFVTVPTKKNQGKAFEQVEKRTFVPLDGPEKGLPHHFFTPHELREVFEDFDVDDLHVDSVAHYCLSAFKRRKIKTGPDED
jgi:SAM-dependent methyltransferase